MMKVQNVAGAVGQVVQVGIDESMVKVRYTDGSESWEGIDSLVLAGSTEPGAVPDDFLAVDNSDIIRGYRYQTIKIIPFRKSL